MSCDPALWSSQEPQQSMKTPFWTQGWILGHLGSVSSPAVDKFLMWPWGSHCVPLPLSSHPQGDPGLVTSWVVLAGGTVPRFTRCRAHWVPPPIPGETIPRRHTWSLAAKGTGERKREHDAVFYKACSQIILRLMKTDEAVINFW